MSAGSGKDRDERTSGGLAREVSVEGLGVERGRGRAEEAMAMALGGFSLWFFPPILWIGWYC